MEAFEESRERLGERVFLLLFEELLFEVEAEAFEGVELLLFVGGLVLVGDFEGFEAGFHESLNEGGVVFDAPLVDGESWEGVFAVEEFEESSDFEEELGNLVEGEGVLVGEVSSFEDLSESGEGVVFGDDDAAFVGVDGDFEVFFDVGVGEFEDGVSDFGEDQGFGAGAFIDDGDEAALVL